MKTIWKKTRYSLLLLGLGVLGHQTPPPAIAAETGSQSVQSVSSPSRWIPPGLPALPVEGPALCPGNYLKPEQGKEVLDYALSVCTNRASWEAYAEAVRRNILSGAGLIPLPRRTPLNPSLRNRRMHDGYSVENVAFEPIPGFYATGNLYRPLKATRPFPVILSTHGHGKNATTAEDLDGTPMFTADMQSRCATLARMGAVVLSMDMFGFGESRWQVPIEAHVSPAAMKMQLWDNQRAIDFLLSLDGADPTRVAVSGESGGGTQSFLLAAVDPRVAVSVPVVMVSAHFFGGCACESGRPIHRTADCFANNAEIAALTAPRPMLIISDGKDWTTYVPDVEYPFLQKVYAFYGRTANVANTHLATEGHDYGPSKRAAMYRFVAGHLKLNLAAVQDARGEIDESKVTIENWKTMRAFDESWPLPGNALHGVAAIDAALQELQRP